MYTHANPMFRPFVELNRPARLKLQMHWYFLCALSLPGNIWDWRNRRNSKEGSINDGTTISEKAHDEA